MKFTIDTTEKTITISDPVNLHELMQELKRMEIDEFRYSIKGETTYIHVPSIYPQPISIPTWNPDLPYKTTIT